MSCNASIVIQHFLNVIMGPKVILFHVTMVEPALPSKMTMALGLVLR